MNVMLLTACLVVNPITVNNFADLCNCGLRINDGSGIIFQAKLAGACLWSGPPGSCCSSVSELV